MTSIKAQKISYVISTILVLFLFSNLLITSFAQAGTVTITETSILLTDGSNPMVANLNMSENQILDGVFHKGSTAPTSPTSGQWFYDTDDLTLYIYNGTSWVASSGVAGPAGVVIGLPYKYRVFTNATSIYMVNGTTGIIDWNSSDADLIVQACFDNMTSTNMTGTISFDTGTYVFDTGVTLTPQYNQGYIGIQGSGWGTIFQTTTNSITVLNVTGYGMNYTERAWNLEIKDLMIQGDTTESSPYADSVGLLLQNGNRWKVENVYVKWFDNQGVIVDNVQGMHFEKCNFRLCGDTGTTLAMVDVDATQPDGETTLLTFHECEFARGEYRNLYVNNSDTLIMTSCYMEGTPTDTNPTDYQIYSQAYQTNIVNMHMIDGVNGISCQRLGYSGEVFISGLRVSSISGTAINIGSQVGSAFIHHNEIGTSNTGIYCGTSNIIFESNIFVGTITTKVSIAAGKTPELRLNKGYNPIGLIATPFDTSNKMIELLGSASVPVALTNYTIMTNGVVISSTDSGDSNCSIVIYDPNGLQTSIAVSSIDLMYLPRGYIINWGNFTGTDPTVKVSFG